MEPKIKVFLTDISEAGSLSVLKQKIAMYDGQETVLENHREALSPGDFDRAKEILPDNLYAQVRALWTDEVVKAYKDSLPPEPEPALYEPPEPSPLEKEVALLTEVTSELYAAIAKGGLA